MSCVEAERLSGSIVLSIAAWLTGSIVQTKRSGRTGLGPKEQIHRCRPGPWVLQCPCETFVATNALSGRQVLTHNS